MPEEEFEEWAKRDPILRFEKFLEASGMWKPEDRERLTTEIADEVNAAARTAEGTPRPALETIFSDVYEDVPDHVRRQGEAAFDLARRKGDAAAGDGEFPL